MLFGVRGVRAYENVARVWVAVDEPRNEDLLCKTFDNIGDYSFLVKPVLFELLIVSHLNTLNPLRHHHPLPRKLINNLWYMQFVSLYFIKQKHT